MPDTPTTTTSLANLTTVAVAEARLVLQARRDLTSTVMVEDLPAGAVSVRFPVITSVEATALTEGQRVTLQEGAATGVLGTPTTKAVYGFELTDLANNAGPSYFANRGRLIGDAIMAKRNRDIFGLFSTFTNTVGDVATALKISTIRKGIAQLIRNGGFGDVYLALTATGWEQLMEDAATQTAGNALISDNRRDAIMAGEIDEQNRWLGAIPIVVGSQIDESGSIVSGLYRREAVGFANGWDVRVEVQRDATLIGWKIVGSAAYDAVVANQTQGIGLVHLGQVEDEE